MSFNLTAGNPRAHRIRVYYLNASSATIYEGMPLCYNNDTTTNWFGGSMTNGAVTASASLTAGTPSTASAKYLEVEAPADGNIQWFAGVVAAGGWVGKKDARALDIYVPNGAIVPVRAGVACTESRTVLSVITGTNYLGHALDATEARPVAIVEETVNRSTAGLILAKLDPNMFIYQEQHGSALLVGTGATAASASQTLNRMKASSAQTGGSFVMLECDGTLTGTGANFFDGMYQFKATLNAPVTDSLVTSVYIKLTFGADATIALPGYVNAPLGITLGSSGTPDLNDGDVAGITFNYLIDETDGAPRVKSLFHVNCGSTYFSHLLDVGTGNIGDATVSTADVTSQDSSSDKNIPILIGRTAYYIRAFASA